MEINILCLKQKHEKRSVKDLANQINNDSFLLQALQHTEFKIIICNKQSVWLTKIRTQNIADL